MSCTNSIIADLATSDTFYAKLASQRAIADPLMDSTRTQTPEDITTLTGVATNLQAISYCLQSLNSSTSTINTDNARKTEKITELTNSINKRKLDIQISQDRALLARHPEMSRSYYESILPIGRPMSHHTVPILIGISTFLLSLSFFIFLSIFNIDARVYIPSFASSTSQSGSATPFWIMTFIAAILLGLVIYKYNS